MDLALVLGRDRDECLQTQIFEQIRGMILNGQLKSGMKLPPSRLLAENFAISRNTVLLAYERLTAEGYIQARGTAGNFVSLSLPDGLLQVEASTWNSDSGTSKPRRDKPSPLLCFAGYPAGPHLPRSIRPKYDFWVGRSDPSTFPVKAWRRITVRKLSGAGFNLTEYGDPAGLKELRIAIANRLGRSRGMSVTPEQVITTAGSQDGLNLVCRLFDWRKYPFFIENPCYKGAAYLFKTVASELYPIPVDENGIVVDRLPRDRPGVVFVTPSHQYPTGVTLSLSRRLCLLKWADQTNSFIIEDDYDSDFRYDGPPLTALAGLDKSHRVFYLGTFSKSLGAGLRLGYAVVPAELAKSARVAKSQMNSGQPWVEEAVLAEFLTSGLFDRHLRRIRHIYKARRDCLRAALERHFGVSDLYGAEGGLHVVWRLPPGSPPADFVERIAREESIGVYTLHSGAAHDFGRSSRQDLLVFGYSSLNERDIEGAIERLSRLLKTVKCEHSSHETRVCDQARATRKRDAPSELVRGKRKAAACAVDAMGKTSAANLGLKHSL